jgi:drug/metabolite transporter (DMT)-like permease
MDHSPSFHQILGYCAALGSASAWALGSILFRKIGEAASPVGMNLGKCIIGAFYLGVVLLPMDPEPMDRRVILTLGVSGLLGIALGDSFFFRALVALGPRLTVLLGTLGPVCTVVLAVVLFKEQLSWPGWVGAALVLSGVNLVLWEDVPSDQAVRRKWGSGIVYALLAALCMSLGIISAKIGMAGSSAMQATFIRIVAAGAGLALWGLATRQLHHWVVPFKDPRLLRLTSVAVLVVMFGGFWLSLVALKFIDVSVATVLNSTEPLFVLPMVALILKEKAPVRGIVGAVVAVVGVALVLHR